MLATLHAGVPDCSETMLHGVLCCCCRGAALLQLLCGYAERFGALLQGHSEDMPLSELMGGARIRHIFQVCVTLLLLQLQSALVLSQLLMHNRVCNNVQLESSSYHLQGTCFAVNICLQECLWTLAAVHCSSLLVGSRECAACCCGLQPPLRSAATRFASRSAAAAAANV
jgi:hypothetical protein